MFNPEKPKSLEDCLNAIDARIFAFADEVKKASGDDQNFESLMRKLESHLRQAGIELSDIQQDELKGLLRERGRDIGWPFETA